MRRRAAFPRRQKRRSFRVSASLRDARVLAWEKSLEHLKSLLEWRRSATEPREIKMFDRLIGEAWGNIQASFAEIRQLEMGPNQRITLGRLEKLLDQSVIRDHTLAANNLAEVLRLSCHLKLKKQ